MWREVEGVSGSGSVSWRDGSDFGPKSCFLRRVLDGQRKPPPRTHRSAGAVHQPAEREGAVTFALPHFCTALYGCGYDRRVSSRFMYRSRSRVSRLTSGTSCPRMITCSTSVSSSSGSPLHTTTLATFPGSSEP